MSNVISNVPSVFVSLSQAPSAKAPQAAGARGLAPNLSLRVVVRGPRIIPINVRGKIGQISVISVTEVTEVRVRTDEMAGWADASRIQESSPGHGGQVHVWTRPLAQAEFFLTSCGGCGST